MKSDCRVSNFLFLQTAYKFITKVLEYKIKIIQKRMGNQDR